MFFTSPLGQSWVEAGGVSGAVIALVGFVVAAALAFLPEVVIGLVAFAAVAVQILGTGGGYLPGDFAHSAGPVIITMIGYGLTRLVVTKVLR